MRRTMKAYQLAEALNPSIGTTRDIIDTCVLICRATTTYQALQLYQCNIGELSDKQRQKEGRLEERITQLCLRLPTVEGKAITPVFQGDPRGATVKLRMPDGRYDDMGKEGICVPLG